jgi:hypothetical protein
VKLSQAMSESRLCGLGLTHSLQPTPDRSGHSVLENALPPIEAGPVRMLRGLLALVLESVRRDHKKLKMKKYETLTSCPIAKKTLRSSNNCSLFNSSLWEESELLHFRREQHPTGREQVVIDFTKKEIGATGASSQ